MQTLYKTFKFAIGGFVCLLILPLIFEGVVSLAVKVVSQKCSDSAFDGQSEVLQQIGREKQRLCLLIASGELHSDLDLAKVVQFDWDTVYFSLPYQTKLALMSKIGFEADALNCSKSGLYDEWTQMIFEYKGDAVMFFDLPTHGIFDYQAIKAFSEGRLKNNSKILLNCN